MGYVINIILDKRTPEDDYPRLIGEFIKQSVTPKYKFWEATVLSHSVIDSIAASHKKIVQWAKDNDLKEVCIAEQDMYFTCPDSWKYFLENKPKEYSVYTSSTYLMPLSANMLTGFHLYFVHHSFYDTFLSVKENNHIDTAISDLKSNHKICYPFVALQRPGFSFNAKHLEMVNYNILIKEEDIYRG